VHKSSKSSTILCLRKYSSACYLSLLSVEIEDIGFKLLIITFKS